MTSPTTRIPPKLAYTVSEAAKQLSLSDKKVREEIEAGRLKATNISKGKKVIFRISHQACVDYLKSNEYVPVPVSMPRRRSLRVMK